MCAVQLESKVSALKDELFQVQVQERSVAESAMQAAVSVPSFRVWHFCLLCVRNHSFGLSVPDVEFIHLQWHALLVLK